MNRRLWGTALFSATLGASPFVVSGKAGWTPSRALGVENTTENSEATTINLVWRPQR